MYIPDNDGVIKCFSQYIPVINPELVDAEQKIWKGERVIEPGSPANAASIVYFSKRAVANNDFDQLFPFLTIKDVRLIGKEFLLVPKEKVLFTFDPPSKIIKRAPIQLSNRQIPGLEI